MAVWLYVFDVVMVSAMAAPGSCCNLADSLCIVCSLIIHVQIHLLVCFCCFCLIGDVFALQRKLHRIRNKAFVAATCCSSQALFTVRDDSLGVSC
jgi:hypothetical protein